MKNEPNKKHHYVPVCYLKGFSENGKSLFVYNKNKNKSYSQSTKNVGCEEDLYTVKDKFIAKEKMPTWDEKYFEKQFFSSGIEAEYGIQLANIKEKATRWILNPNKDAVLTSLEKEELSLSIVVQFLRLPEVSERFYKMYNSANRKRLDLINAFFKAENPEWKDSMDLVQTNEDREQKAVIHAQIYTSQQLLDEGREILLKKAWGFMVSSSNDLYTSDYPIATISQIPNQPFVFQGLGMKGAQVLFPLASNILLSMYDVECFDNKNFALDSFVPLTNRMRDRNNLYQYAFANRDVYSARNDFSVIVTAIKENGGKPLNLQRPGVTVA
ncbi:uncharacterized protein DUF4238 [Chitinophaga polysaccharea]|uniref:Uncharacterized protein DUF4238 n=1 Tax=Chitinophaga polysaccharea TaxID=1293035 RepID=A0A561PNA6_9BACT|nr:DUF4238 domain-containing protein [Chitinophaga polysaccharea]TWF39603.1 uncharacterized protein DUF4238 [Chitinophaga polysaccharea]